jgi:hypothetical protein
MNDNLRFVKIEDIHNDLISNKFSAGSVTIPENILFLLDESISLSTYTFKQFTDRPCNCWFLFCCSVRLHKYVCPTESERFNHLTILDTTLNQQQVSLIKITQCISKLSIPDKPNRDDRIQIRNKIKALNDNLSKLYYWSFGLGSYDNQLYDDVRQARTKIIRSFILSIISVALLIFPIINTARESNISLFISNIVSASVTIINIVFVYIENLQSLGRLTTQRDKIIDSIMIAIRNRLDEIMPNSIIDDSDVQCPLEISETDEVKVDEIRVDEVVTNDV